MKIWEFVVCLFILEKNAAQEKSVKSYQYFIENAKLEITKDRDELYHIWGMVYKKICKIPGVQRVLDISPKNVVDPTIGLGGVRPHTDTHTETYRGPTAIIV